MGRFLRAANKCSGVAAYCIEHLEKRQMLSGSGTKLLGAINPVTADSFESPTEAGGKFFFAGYKGTNPGPEMLFESDGVSGSATTLLTADISGIQDNYGITALTAYHNKLYFFANTSTGDALYVSDGTVAGTQVVKSIRVSTNSSLPPCMASLNDKLLFVVPDDSQPAKMYLSDGTSAGTTQVWSGPVGATAMSSAVGGNIFFSTYDGELWRTNGTSAGTVQVSSMVSDSLHAGADFKSTANKLFFIQRASGDDDGGGALYSVNFDGTGLTAITDPTTQNVVTVSDYTVVGNHVLFNGGSREAYLFSTDGVNSDTVQIAGSSTTYAQDSELVGSGGTATFITGAQSDPSANQLWLTDGTVAGTREVLSTFPTRSYSDDFSVGGKAIYTTSDDLHLVVTDGTASGTRTLNFPGFDKGGGVFPFGQFQNQRVLIVSNSLWALDPNVATGSIGGQAYFDDKRNGAYDATDRELVGTVYLDLNNDGIQQATEPGIFVDQASYLFDGLPADQYVLRFSGYGTYSGTRITTPASTNWVINLQANQNITTANFVAADNTVRGTVFSDANQDGVYDQLHENFIDGAVVYLDYNNNGYHDSNEPTATVRTDTEQYEFLDAAVGTYPVRRNEVSGNIQTTPAGRAGIMIGIDGSVGITTVAPFGITSTATGSISGVVWNDWNHDGALDGGDVQMSGLTLYLDQNGDGIYNTGLDPTTSTDSFGRYSFTSRNPGPYMVGIVPVANQVQSSPVSGGFSTTLAAGGAVTLPNFFVYKTNVTPPGGKITGHVFSDHNSNKTSDANEPPAWGTTVWIDADQDGVLDPEERRAVTDLAGNYSFPNSASGTYRLRVSLPTGATKTTPTTTPTTLSLTTNQQLSASDFGVHFSDSTAPAVQSLSLGVNTKPLSLQIQMSEDIAGTVDATDVVINSTANPSVNITPTAASFDRGTNIASFILPASLADGNYTSTMLANSVSDVAGNLLATATTNNFFILAADANHDRFVNALDFNALATNYGKAATFGQGDFDYSGTVDSNDFAMLSSRFGTYLAPPSGGDVPHAMPAKAAALSLAARPLSLFSDRTIANDSALLDDLPASLIA